MARMAPVLPLALPVAGPSQRATLRSLLGGSGLALALLVAIPPLIGGARSKSTDPATPATGALASGPEVRVLLLEGPVLTIGAAGPAGLRLSDRNQRTVLEVEPGQQLRVRRSGTGLTLETLASTRASESGGDTVGAAPRPIPLQELRLTPLASQGLLVVKQRRYRGSLLLRPEGEGLQAINLVPLESYLPGVVGSEMPPSWPLAALRAQAIASRTYALQQRRPHAPYDLQATVTSQVYKGVESETPSVREAVASTRAQVLMHGERLINAVFHSSSGGGRTENSGDLWSRQLPYLVSVADDDAISPVSRWEKTFTPEALRKAFQEIGGANTIQPVELSNTGRVRRVRVIGPGGELTLSGSGLRERLGLRSTLVRFRFEPAGRAEDLARSSHSDGNPSEGSPSDSATGLEGGQGSAFEGGPPRTRSVGLASPPPLPREAGMVAAAASNDAAMAGSTPSPAMRLVVQGRGYGHGVGMSQWGAYALALRGKSHEDILRHYYRGAVLRTW
jgi:stage II sporulation protein D